MRHLNEIVRERNQYSRDAMEAWQDFINLKGRMDGELAKVTKRNNFLVDELESWKQQVNPAATLNTCGSTNKVISSLNSKLSQSSSLKRPKSSRSRLRPTNARTAVLLLLSSNKRTTLLASLSALMAQRSNVTTLSKRSSSSRKSPRSSNANASVTRKSSPLYNIPTQQFYANATSLAAWSFISAA